MPTEFQSTSRSRLFVYVLGALALLLLLAGMEKIDNPAGSFDALRIDGSRTHSTSAEAYTSTEWFAYGIGQVRSERIQSEDGRDVVSKLELASYNVP